MKKNPMKKNMLNKFRKKTLEEIMEEFAKGLAEQNKKLEECIRKVNENGNGKE